MADQVTKDFDYLKIEGLGTFKPSGSGGGGAVDSVNGKTGAVVLDASDVGALSDDTQIPSNTSDLTNDSGFVTAQQAAASAPVQSVNGKTGAVVLGAADVHALPDSTVIPPTVTEQTVAGWGFTKNTGTYSKPSGGIPDSDITSAATWNAKGTYSKPSGGIPKSDLASAVQTSLGKADSAYQKPSGGIPASDLASGVIPTVPSASSSAPVMDGTASAGSSAAYARGDHVHPSDTTKQDTLTFDNAPTENSNNPVKSGGVYTALSGKQSTTITDTGGYYTTDTVEGALQEIGAELAGINTLIGTGVIS